MTGASLGERGSEVSLTHPEPAVALGVPHSGQGSQTSSAPCPVGIRWSSRCGGPHRPVRLGLAPLVLSRRLPSSLPAGRRFSSTICSGRTTRTGSTVPIVAFRLLWAAFGMRSYVPYQAVGAGFAPHRLCIAAARSCDAQASAPGSRRQRPRHSCSSAPAARASSGRSRSASRAPWCSVSANCSSSTMTDESTGATASPSSPVSSRSCHRVSASS